MKQNNFDTNITAIGKIISIKGQVVEIDYLKDPPRIFDILVLPNDKSAKLEVIASATNSTFYCLSMSSTLKLCRGMEVINTGKKLSIPAGKAVLGRVMDVFGDSHDDKGDIVSSEEVLLHSQLLK